jgi:S1-C subfamily serine protease
MLLRNLSLLVILLFILTGCASTPPLQTDGVYAVSMSENQDAFLGSAFRIDENYVATAAHVVGSLNYVHIGDTVGTVDYLDTIDDIAIVFVPKLSGTIYTSNIAVNNENATAIGFVFADNKTLKIATSGQVGYTDADTIIYDGGTQVGMSGGPLFNLNGGVIGMVSGVASWHGIHPNPTMGIYVPSHKIEAALRFVSSNKKKVVIPGEISE